MCTSIKTGGIEKVRCPKVDTTFQLISQQEIGVSVQAFKKDVYHNILRHHVCTSGESLVAKHLESKVRSIEDVLPPWQPIDPRHISSPTGTASTTKPYRIRQSGSSSPTSKRTARSSASRPPQSRLTAPRPTRSPRSTTPPRARTSPTRSSSPNTSRRRTRRGASSRTAPPRSRGSSTARCAGLRSARSGHSSSPQCIRALRPRARRTSARRASRSLGRRSKM